MGWGSSARRVGGRKVRALLRKFVFLGFRREESGMSREFCRDVPDLWGCSKSLCKKSSCAFFVPLKKKKHKPSFLLLCSRSGFVRKKLLQKSKGNLSEQSPRRILRGILFGGFFRPFFLDKNRRKTSTPQNPRQNSNQNLGVSSPKSTLQGSGLEVLGVHGTSAKTTLFQRKTKGQQLKGNIVS